MPHPFPGEKLGALRELLFRGRKIEAVKLYRESTRLGLKESKDAIDALEVSLRKSSPGRFTAAPRDKGCLACAAALGLGAGILIWLLGAG